LSFYALGDIEFDATLLNIGSTSCFVLLSGDEVPQFLKRGPDCVVFVDFFLGIPIVNPA
jgi:hypothetical protein